MGMGKLSYELTFWFISIENGGKQKSKNTLRVEINQLCYTTHFLKSRDSVIRKNFFEYRTKQAPLVTRRNDFYALLATNKATHILNWHVSCSCSDTIYSKSITRNRKFPIFESSPFL